MRHALIVLSAGLLVVTPASVRPAASRAAGRGRLATGSCLPISAVVAEKRLENSKASIPQVR